MCYNFESSINSLSLGWISAYLMFKRNSHYDMLLWPFIFTYSFVQLADALIWYDKDCGQLNKIGTYIAYYSLVLQPLSVGIGSYMTSKNYMGIILGLLSFLYYTYYQPKIKCTKKMKNLNWGFDSSFYFVQYFLISITLTFFSNMKIKVVLFLFIWFAVILLYLIQKQYNINNLQRFNQIFGKLMRWDLDQQYASIWCNSAAVSAPLLYFLGETKFIL